MTYTCYYFPEDLYRNNSLQKMPTIQVHWGWNICFLILHCVAHTYVVSWLRYISRTWAWCNMGYLSETHLKLKSRAKSRLPITYFAVAQSFWNFAQSTTVLCAKFHNDWTPEMDVIDERHYATFEFKISFGRISQVAQGPCSRSFCQRINQHGCRSIVYIHNWIIFANTGDIFMNKFITLSTLH